VTWVRLADDFADHPKIVAAGALAAWQFVCGLAYCNKHLTDGFIPRGAVRRLADVEDPFRLAATLVDVGLWESVDGGWMVHDYLNYQPSRQTVVTEREKTAERVAAWRERQRGNADGNASGNDVRTDVGNGEGNECPGPARSRPLSSPGPVPAGAPPKPPSQAMGADKRRGGRSRRDAVRGGHPPIPTEPAAYTSGEYGQVAARHMAAKLAEE
jgi:hypothetical protein